MNMSQKMQADRRTDRLIDSETDSKSVGIIKFRVSQVLLGVLGVSSGWVHPLEMSRPLQHKSCWV